ncbi:MAG: Flagellar motor switch protein FliM [Steroidobacteraceae bacterium]|nr:Flagellar motor switch protein FliM [Steroidobacteraceae bacterium]
MTGQQLLNQDEVDALLHGVDSGAVGTDSPPPPGEVRPYDFGSEMRIVRGRMPTLEMLNERFARLFRASLYNLLRRSLDVSVGPVQMRKFGEYVQTLHLPSSLNLVRVTPLRGTGLVVLGPSLVFAIVDSFFGGNGRQAKIEGRDFTATESRVIHMLLTSIFADLREAWSHIAPIEIEFLSSEVNPRFANIVSATEVVVITSFHVDLDGGGGELHVTLPYSMIEPLRDVLDSGVQSDRAEIDERWPQALREEIEDAEVQLDTVLGRAQLSLAQLLNLKPGDIVPCDFNGRATVLVEDVPLFRGGFGVSRGQQAVKVEERVRRARPNATPPHDTLARGQ